MSAKHLLLFSGLLGTLMGGGSTVKIIFMPITGLIFFK